MEVRELTASRKAEPPNFVLIPLCSAMFGEPLSPLPPWPTPARIKCNVFCQLDEWIMAPPSSNLHFWVTREDGIFLDLNRSANLPSSPTPCTHLRLLRRQKLDMSV